MLHLPDADVHKLVKRLKSDYFRSMHVLPYNRFNLAKSSLWWLSPAPDKNGCRYGKAVFAWDDEEDHLLCGLMVEKGVREGGTSNPKDVLDDGWFWHDFLKLAAEELPRQLEEVAEIIGESPITIRVTAGPLLVPNADSARVRLQVEGDRLEQTAYHPADGTLSAVAASKDFPTFAKSLQDFTADHEFFWCTVIAGTPCTLGSRDRDDTNELTQMLGVFRD